jgi:iron complex transport system ATP-binding protein
MIELKDLTIGYAQKNNTKVVASGINATLHSGRLTCLIGANGIGKSTLLRTLSAFQPPLSGEIYIDNESPIPLSTLTDKQLSRLIGVVLTEKPDVQNMTVFELVGLGRSPYTGFWGRLNEDDKEVVKESLRLVGIESLQDRLIQTLSDGERQKTMIAKALAQQTPVIYLDEPTAFLDYPSKVEMLTLLRHLARETGKTIFLSTHDMELALQIADELWLMTAGTPSSDTAESPSNNGLCQNPKETTLIIGTPRELAANGSLSHFIDRPGLHFDPQTLAIRVTNRE